MLIFYFILGILFLFVFLIFFFIKMLKRNNKQDGDRINSDELKII